MDKTGQIGKIGKINSFAVPNILIHVVGGEAVVKTTFGESDKPNILTRFPSKTNRLKIDPADGFKVGSVVNVIWNKGDWYERALEVEDNRVMIDMLWLEPNVQQNPKIEFNGDPEKTTKVLWIKVYLESDDEEEGTGWGIEPKH